MSVFRRGRRHRHNDLAQSVSLQVDFEIKRSCMSKKMQWNYSNAAKYGNFQSTSYSKSYISEAEYRVLVTDRTFLQVHSNFWRKDFKNRFKSQVKSHSYEVKLFDFH